MELILPTSANDLLIINKQLVTAYYKVAQEGRLVREWRRHPHRHRHLFMPNVFLTPVCSC